MSLKPGAMAPSFETVTATGETIRLEDFRGKYVVLYFYPMDGTPACTAQACSLRDVNDDLMALGAVVMGASSQSASSHDKFRKKYQLNFYLLDDHEQRIASAYDATGQHFLGKLTRRLFRINQRVTYLIDPQGKIVAVFDDPKWGDHGSEVLERLRQEIAKRS